MQGSIQCKWGPSGVVTAGLLSRSAPFAEKDLSSSSRGSLADGPNDEVLHGRGRLAASGKALETVRFKPSAPPLVCYWSLDSFPVSGVQ